MRYEDEDDIEVRPKTDDIEGWVDFISFQLEGVPDRLKILQLAVANETEWLAEKSRRGPVSNAEIDERLAEKARRLPVSNAEIEELKESLIKVKRDEFVMKAKPLDKRNADRLGNHGFLIAADAKTATRSGAMTVEIIQPVHNPGAFEIQITFADHSTLNATAYRLSSGGESGDEPEEDDEPDDEPEEDDAA